MSTSYFFCLLSVVALLATGCEKEKLESCPGQCTVVTGRLLTSSQQALADAPVSIAWISRGSLLGNKVRTKARTTTTTSGNFQLSFYVQDDELQDGYFSVTYEVDQNRYYVIDNTDALDTGSGPAVIKRDTTYQLRPYLIPRKATVKLTVPNASQVQGIMFVDFASAQGGNLSFGSRLLGGGSAYQVTNQPGPFTATTPVAADQPLYIRVSKMVNGTNVRTLDSLVMGAGTARDVSLTY